MSPFPTPRTLPPRLERALAFWRDLIRARAPMPFWDDLSPADMGDLRKDAFTLEVFDKPERFRFALVGESLEPAGARDLEGTFLGEGPLPAPFDYLLAQASATVEAAKPTLHRGPGATDQGRLLLPMWGDGRIGLLLGVVDPGRAAAS